MLKQSDVIAVGFMIYSCSHKSG